MKREIEKKIIYGPDVILKLDQLITSIITCPKTVVCW